MAASLITEGVFQGNQDPVKFMGTNDLYTLGKESETQRGGLFPRPYNLKV